MESVDLLLETGRQFLHQLAEFMPKLALALVVIVIGLLLAKLVRLAVVKGLRAINFNVLSERAGVDNFLRQGGMSGDAVTLIGALAFWAVILAAFIIAFNGLGLAYITDLLVRVVWFLPKLLVALLIVIFGSYFAKFCANAVQTYCVDAGVPDGDVLSKIAQYLIMTFVVMIALTQVEVGGDIVQKTFLILLGGIVLALALAFGIGGKDWAANLLERWWPQLGKRRDRE